MMRFVKFCVVGGSGALLQLAITYVLTEKFGFWYMASVCVAIGMVVVWNYFWNAKWTFGRSHNPSDADYEWNAFYNGNFIQKWWKRHIARIIWEWIPGESRLINLGCGSSPIATKYPHSVNVDMNKAKIDFLSKEMPLATFIQGDISSMPTIERGSFDHVICAEVIEHSQKPELVVSEISRILKKDGRVIFATPDYARVRWHFFECFTPYKESHGAKLTKAGLEMICREYGLRPVKYEYVAGCDLVEMFEKS